MSTDPKAQAIRHLTLWLHARLPTTQNKWLGTRLALIRAGASDQDLHITLGLIPRKLGRNDLNLDSADIQTAQTDCGVDWDPSDWSIDTAARCLVLATVAERQADEFDRIFADLCSTAELNESIAFYRSTAILQGSAALDEAIGNALRTHIRAMFDAIAHRNPYPRHHFGENRWNHMILKALFVGSELWPVQGIDERANPELARILCDYAHERWAAHRLVTPELWRCVGPFAVNDMLEDLHRVATSDITLEREAGLLALTSCPQIDIEELRREHTDVIQRIEQGKINWQTIGMASAA